MEKTNLKFASELNGYFVQSKYANESRDRERYAALSILSKMLIKISKNYSFILIKIMNIKTAEENKCCQECRETRTLCLARKSEK